jgi:hypothetical protein
MKYAYEDLGDDQFEALVVLICQRLLGMAVQPFAKGPDGGRDAKFVGTAELHPSKAAPWEGITIVQAKHTNGINRSFSDLDFYNPAAKKTVLSIEIPRIQKLRKEQQLDHYMLFSNRRLAGNAEAAIRAYLSGECNLQQESIHLCGIEHLELLLKNFPEIPALAKLDPIDSPLNVSPHELAEVVHAFARHMETIDEALEDPPSPRVPYATKNSINNMTPAYAKEQQRRYLKETSTIQRFLAAPENADLLESYESVVEDFQFKIISKRRNYQTFDEVMEYLLDLLFKRDPILRQRGNRRLTRMMLFYMYWNCDIGEDSNVATD